MAPRNRFQGMNSSSLCSLAGRYDNPYSSSVPSPHRLFKNPSSALTIFFKGNELTHRRINFREAHNLILSLIKMSHQSPHVSKHSNLLVAILFLGKVQSCLLADGKEWRMGQLQQRRHKIVGFCTCIHSVVFTIRKPFYPIGTKNKF